MSVCVCVCVCVNHQFVQVNYCELNSATFVNYNQGLGYSASDTSQWIPTRDYHCLTAGANIISCSIGFRN